MRRIRNFFRLILVLIIDGIAKLQAKKAEIKENTILLIRLDAIGDYILFRNFIEILKKSEKYKKYQITLCGNIAWKELAEEYDSAFIDRFIWLDRNRFYKNPIYRYRTLRKISSIGYAVIIQPTYSREFYYGDAIIKCVSAKEKIGSLGDLSNIKKWQKRISDKYYTKLLPAKNEIMFEFYRNKEFFENLLDEKMIISKPYLKVESEELKFDISENYCLLFVDAGGKFRRWPVGKFAKVARYIKERYNLEIVVCGGLNLEKEVANNFSNSYKYKFLNLVGKTTLTDMVYIVRNAKLIISNETFVPHIAVALDKEVIVIYNGNHFGRFTPYPSEMTSKYFVVYHPEIEKDLDNYKKLSNSYGYGSKLNIDDIGIDKIIEKINEVFKSKAA